VVVVILTKATVECYQCHQLGHFSYECPRNKEASHVETIEEEKLLLMAYEESFEFKRKEAWFLDSGCLNNMCGDSTLFHDLDETFRHSVKLGNNTKMNVMGKGSIRLSLGRVNLIITEVYYIPELRNNLLNMGQLQEKGLAILIKERKCKIFHPEKGLIIQTNMSANRMFFSLPLSSVNQCFQIITEDLSHLWQTRYGHLSYSGLRTLLSKNMVRG